MSCCTCVGVLVGAAGCVWVGTGEGVSVTSGVGTVSGRKVGEGEGEGEDTTGDCGSEVRVGSGAGEGENTDGSVSRVRVGTGGDVSPLLPSGVRIGAGGDVSGVVACSGAGGRDFASVMPTIDAASIPAAIATFGQMPQPEDVVGKETVCLDALPGETATVACWERLLGLTGAGEVCKASSI